jgi:hypothetical protein
VFKVPASLGTGLNKTLEDFRNKKLFDFGYQDPSKIEFHDGPKAYFLTRSGSDWWGADGKQLDASSVDSFINRLRDLSADKFPDTGSANPELQIIVTSQDGKHVEKLSLAKSGDAFIGKRENEPVLYQVSSASVGELQKAASELKPATAAKK